MLKQYKQSLSRIQPALTISSQFLDSRFVLNFKRKSVKTGIDMIRYDAYNTRE